MAFPTADRLTALLTPLVERDGVELDDVTVASAGRRNVVRVVLDSEEGLDLDAVAASTRIVSSALDAEPDTELSAYTLEVTTPGTDRPLTSPRHWRRNRGRRVDVRLDGEQFSARIGAVDGEEVVLVLAAPSRRGAGPELRRVAFAEVVHAAVEVEFSVPDPRELALTADPDHPTTDGEAEQ